MKKIRVMLASVLAIFALGLSTAPAPAAQQSKYADYVYHGPVGNSQGVAVQCTVDGSTKWLLQGQDSGKCPYSDVSQWYVPAGYNLCVRPYYNPNVGCQFQYSGGYWWGAPAGAWYVWSVHN